MRMKDSWVNNCGNKEWNKPLATVIIHYMIQYANNLWIYTPGGYPVFNL